MARRLKPGWRCIDVGANLGYYTLLMALITGAEVEAWEPMLDLHRLLESTIQLNGLAGRVTQRLWAASDTAEDMKLFRIPRDFGSASLREQAGAREYPVQTARIDRGTALPRVDFVKIDAEGHEPAIWRGMEDLFERGEPHAVMMEWAPKRYEDPKGFLDDIRKRGFKVNLVDGAGALQAPKGDITELDGYTDLWLER
jgi:FkbM family methyltransferase